MEDDPMGHLTQRGVIADLHPAPLTNPPRNPWKAKSTLTIVSQNLAQALKRDDLPFILELQVAR